MTKPLRSSDNRSASDYEAYLLARIDALEMKVRDLTAIIVTARKSTGQVLSDLYGGKYEVGVRLIIDGQEASPEPASEPQR